MLLKKWFVIIMKQAKGCSPGEVIADKNQATLMNTHLGDRIALQV